MASSTEDPAASDASTPNGDGEAVGKRRIVKAHAPKASENGKDGEVYSYPSPTGASNGTPNDNDHADDEDIPATTTKRNKSSNKDDDDQTTEWRNERLKLTGKRGKALREKELQERRKNNTANESANATANPFSRFLSVFSVEPQFPEHKRSLETDDDKEQLQPSGKRLKASTDDTDDDDDIDKTSSGGVSWMVAAAAVAAVAVGVAIALQRGRKP
ncbi:expressed unknown protein [Seminavis robusta]|uniref:Uncharacterized protein n=1 Tax=Seminavis robusta TaxID=568900 RepID=A0A9N8D8G6_9STRA|nr:expressed unknown protein [Seminavis robusta]|eukprot:Sro30_g019810.1 n/a (216) ;mRNA; r:132333-132980